MLRTAILFFLPVIAAAAPAPVDDGARVAVLGYHDFSETEEQTEMRILTSKFRQQMQTLHDLNLPVISMEEFQKWKRGEADLPPRSVMITIDDGWKSVYTDAFPILKEFGYPFTLFLYKNYVDGGGKALSTAMIKEMKKHGATIGSHSVGHPYPATLKEHRSKGPDAYDKFLRTQMGESKRFLEVQFGDEVTTYAYPGGFHTEEMYPLAEEFGYQQLFTVIPEKVKRDSDDLTLPRYVVLGTHDHIFDLAIRFGTIDGGDPGALAAISKPTRFPVTPEPGSLVGDRLPGIAVDLSEAGEIDAESLTMRIGGFGTVPATWDVETRQLQWKVNRPLRLSQYDVEVRWKNVDEEESPEPLRWTFRLDRETAYVPRG
ncbi:polysaccharide deacetylase family protein [Haloferula sp. A504]|uniref:polysaccharide deacetylase family protein n=1 Tax=Haloferula sp. A504 TaxID=3373601 RepID=UPI0031C5B7D1|nr:polysaccharide deacetylase family protein [Verrucomicrobiaceae bacterium E54]